MAPQPDLGVNITSKVPRANKLQMLYILCTRLRHHLQTRLRTGNSLLILHSYRTQSMLPVPDDGGSQGPPAAQGSSGDVKRDIRESHVLAQWQHVLRESQ